MIIFNNRHQSVIHRLDPRFRVVGALVFAFLVALSERPAVLLLGLAAAVVLAMLARLPARNARKLAQVNLFLLMLAVLLPLFVEGQAVLSIGRVSWSREGFAQAFVIAARANAILVAVLALLTTMEPAQLGAALFRLGCPAKLAHLFLFLVRYIEVIHREYHSLRTAMKLRAFRPALNRHTLKSLGYLVGQLLLRSFERSDRIMEAMKCRGFRGRFYVLRQFRLSAGDAVFAMMTICFLASMAVLEWA